MTRQDQPVVEETPDPSGKQGETDSEVIDHVEDLIENDPLVRLFGDHPRTRILMALLDAYPRSMNPSSIVDQAKVSRQSWYRHKDELIETGIMEKVGEAGNSPLYALVDADEDNRIEWLQKLRDWTGAFERDGTRPSP